MPKIEAIYAFIAVEKEPDDEGVAAIKIGNVWMPLVGADMARVNSLKRIAQDIADLTGKKINLVKFTTRTEIETITPAQTERR